MNYQKIGETIKERRKSLNITQPTLASLAGVGLNTLVAIERGNGNAKIHTIFAILDTLGLKIDVTLKD
ncbi:MAG: helix-turn-helix transcriptional regulator [Barnesiella sp.]|nr:helix-turn-helix transcriptional regulator [Barnesiella sp.]